MLQQSRTWLGVQVARFRFRNETESVISFTNAVSSARHALLVMPLDRAHRFPAVPVLDFLTQRFPQENITIVTAEQDYQTMRMLPHTTLMRMLVSEVNPLLLPRKDIVQRVLGREYDLAIDLNLDLVLPSAYICRASKARVRIGFARKHADFFYNLAINVDPARDRKQVYDTLVRCLQMF